MGCKSRAVLIVFLFSLLLSSVKNTAHNEDGVRKILNEQEKWNQNGIVIVKIIENIMESFADMQKGPRNNSFLHVFNLFGDLISEPSQLGDFNVTQMFRQLVLRNIDRAKKELAGASKTIEWLSQVTNNSPIDYTDVTNLWQTKVTEYQHFIEKYRSACHVVDDLITLSSMQLHKCCNVTVKPIISICRILLAKGSTYMTKMTCILNHIHDCLEINFLHSKYTLQCVQFVYFEITNLIQCVDNMIRKLIVLLQLKILYSKCCISLALVEEIEKNKNVIIAY